MIDLVSAVSIANSGITVTTSPDYLLDGLTASYVLLTLALAVIAFRSLSKTQTSLDLTRQQIEINKQQSQATIEAVNKQIVASETQAREALYTQHQPIVVPISPLYTRKDALEMRNAGSGIALNTWGILTVVSTNKFYRFGSTHFLIPEKTQETNLLDISKSLDFMFPIREFSGYSIYPPPDMGKIGTDMRLMLTYNDVFGNIYFGVYDYSTFGWRQVEEMKRIEQRLDEYLEEIRSQTFQNQQTISK